MESFKNTNENLEKESFGKFKGEDGFVFLSQEELDALDEEERFLYNSRLQENEEAKQKEYYSKAPEIEQNELDENKLNIQPKNQFPKKEEGSIKTQEKRKNGGYEYDWQRVHNK